MRLGLLVIVLAGCSTPATPGPAWPKARVRPIDGGESLAPRPAARAIAAIVEDDKPADRPAADRPVASPAGGLGSSTVDKPAVLTPAATTPPSDDDPLMTEDIVIEIED